MRHTLLRSDPVTCNLKPRSLLLQAIGYRIIVVVCVIGFFALITSSARAISDTTHVELGVYHCDNDATCEIAENAEFCPLDCVAPPATTTEETDEEDTPPQSTRVVEQIIDLFQTLVPFSGEGEEPTFAIDEHGDVVCADGSCTAFTEDLARSVIVSFEDSFGEKPSPVSISPVSGNEIAFAWEAGAVVRIMRSDKEFPIDPWSGELVYEGASGEFTADATEGADIMYYSLFPQNEDGSYGDPEFIIVKSNVVPEEAGATSTLFKLASGTFLVTVLSFIGRFIFLLI